jgi:DNA-directed RNA polymerase subunit RPC12/RpoP
MKEEPRPRRRSEVFKIECWRCRGNLELPVNEPPYRCPYCGIPLLIQWRSTAPPLSTTQPSSRKEPAETAYRNY